MEKNQDIQSSIVRAKELLTRCRHAAMATVNRDGSPHNTPFFFMYDKKLEYLYWGSHLESLHSQNVERTGKVFVVLFDAIEKGGLYISGENGHVVQKEELGQALEVHNEFRVRLGKKPLPLDYYTEHSPQQMWSAKTARLWVNCPIRDSSGLLVKDERHEIAVEDLLA